MTKVLRVLNRFNLGGPTYNVAYLSRYLDKNFESILVGGEPEKGETDSMHIMEDLGLKPIILPELKRNPNLLDDIKAYRALRKLIREHKPDIVHTHAAKAGALGRLAAIHEKVPVIVHTFHGHVFNNYFSSGVTKIFIQIERWLAKRSTKIIAISEEQKKDLSEVYRICPEEKIEIVPLGFDLERFREDLDLKRNKTRTDYNLHENTIAVAIVGRLAPIKNHQLFLEALRIIQEKTQKKVHAFVVGDGLERHRLEEMAKAWFKKDMVQITFTSWIHDIGTFNAGMDIMCLTSLNEGTPVSLIEAQACNLPIVSTWVGGVESVVNNEESGFLIEVGRPDLFAEKLLDLIENEELRKKMSQNGWSFVRDKYALTTLVGNMEKLYAKLL